VDWPTDAVAAYLRAVVERLQSLLDDELIAVWLIGSYAVGGVEPNASDVDVIVVVRGALGEDRKRRLAEELAEDRLPCPARKLELVVYARGQVVGRIREPHFELNLNTAGPEPSHWFMLDLVGARSGGRALLGPSPAELLPELPRDWILDALRQSLYWHAAEEPESANSVLNACRAWRYAEEGSWSSKPEGATWASDRSGDSALIQHALALRSGAQTAPLASVEVARFLERARAAVEASR
jgi:aminoglycoside adenylyltransferase-like protein/nucleotidyltransferase-like protein